MSIPGWNLLFPLAGIVVFSTGHLLWDRNRDRARTLEIVLLYSIGIIGFNGWSSSRIHWAISSPSRSAGRPHRSSRSAGANLAIA